MWWMNSRKGNDANDSDSDGGNGSNDYDCIL